MSVIDEIKARVDIVELVSETMQLRRSGKNYTGFCPFHANTRTPAFVVFPESGTWRCFGQCNEGGDVFGYVMKREGVDFSEALRLLAEKTGVELKPITAKDQEATEEHDRLRSLLEEAVTFYRHHLMNTSAGKTALEYLHKRSLKDATIEVFGLGYAPNAWEETLGHFKSKSYSEDDLRQAGLISEREGGRKPGERDSTRPGVYDRFRNRIMFPIRDERGRMAGFGARILDPNDVPKFLNSPQTVLFDKGHLLYGLDQARKQIRSSDQVVIVEGYLDVIALHQAGYANAVSPMGTALTEHQLYLLKRFTRRIVLALDPDAAGDKATLRGLQIARQAMDHEQDPVFDARGLMGYEARLQADIRVTTLPAGIDPDEVVNRDPKEWECILENARPIVIHVMETLAAQRDLDDPKVKSEIAAQTLPLIEDVANPVERDAYRQKLARLLHVDERSLVGAARPPSGGRRHRQTSQPRAADGLGQATTVGTRSPADASYTLEAHSLGVLLRRPDLLYKIDRSLQEAGLARLSVDDFLRSDHQVLFHLIQDSLDQEEAEPLNYVLNHLSLPMMEAADELLRRTEKMDPNEEHVFEDLQRALIDQRRNNIRQNIDHLRFLMEEAQEQGDLADSQYMQSIQMYSQVLNRLQRAREQSTMGHRPNRSIASRGLNIKSS
jgi:DNA primase